MNFQNIVSIVILVSMFLLSILFVVVVVKYHLRIRASVTALGVRIACALSRTQS